MPDPSRFEALLLPHLDAAYNLARWLTRDPHDAEDVVQDACVRGLRYLPSMRGGEARAWFLTIVRHASYDWLGRHHHRIWLWTCLAGTILGVIGYLQMVRHKRMGRTI